MRRHKRAISIVYCVFSFTALVTGTVAWFSSNTSVNANGMAIDVEMPTGDEFVGASLYKYEYPSTASGTDYLSPEKGTVVKYELDPERNTFGRLVDGVWTPYEMNIYDPLDVMISQSSLFSLNTSVVYELKVRSTKNSVSTINVNALINDQIHLSDSEREILASDVFDFDAYTSIDFEDSGLTTLIDGKHIFFPSYAENQWQDIDEDGELSTNEKNTQKSLLEIFFKSNYLSTQKASSNNRCFYRNSSAKSNQINLLNNAQIETDAEGIATIYLNVNYSVGQLAYYQTLVSDRTFTVVSDYKVSLSLS